MLHSLGLNLLFGLLILGMIVGFNTLTQGIFIPVLSFQNYGIRLFEEFRANPNLLVAYFLLLLLHLAIAGICTWFRTSLSRDTTTLDIFIICAVPMFVYLVVSAIPPLIEEIRLGALSRNNDLITGEPLPIVALRMVRAYLVNTLILFLGGLLGWLTYKNFN